ncbi:hypothetical protein GCM10011378_20890 [Hymenobacter glacieicola]|uniref:Uncharacterized protein n=1 Tax=Hymenobacter glacieicola TaxID=1562124 RepID=A0ABQ1WVL8_9BACT|nr:hypothetical protein GCM10011378_20890 [Hymenobacter glacieicola]
MPATWGCIAASKQVIKLYWFSPPCPAASANLLSDARRGQRYWQLLPATAYCWL